MMYVRPARYTGKYQMIHQFLRERIAGGDYAVGDRIMSEDELAQTFGVSKGPVRQAVSLLVQEGVLRKIQGKGTFVCGRPGNNAAKRTADPVCVFVPAVRRFGHAYYDVFLEGLSAQANELNVSLDIVIHHDQLRAAGSTQQLRAIERHASRASAVISLVRKHSLPELQTMLRLQKPLLLVHADYTHLGLQIPCIARPYPHFCEQAIQILLDHGHRHLLFLDYRRATSDAPAHVQRTVQAAGATMDLMIEANPYRLLERLKAMLRTKNRPTALFASRFELSQAIVDMVESNLLNLPGDISAIGYSEVHLGDALNLIVPPLHQTARTALRQVLKLDDQPADLTAQLIDNQTIAPPVIS